MQQSLWPKGILGLGLVLSVGGLSYWWRQATPFASSLLNQPIPPELLAKVIAVPAGDTLITQMQGRQRQIRLCGIDAPELTQPHGKAAQAALQNWINQHQGQVKVVALPDQPDRSIAEVFLPAHRFSSSDAVLLNQKLLESGLAYSYAPYIQHCPHHTAMMAAETTAQQTQQGVWRDSDQLPPWQYRRQRLLQIAQRPDRATALRRVSANYLHDGMQTTHVELASWYGPGLHGGLTASGERFNQMALTAAHASLPFHVHLRVTNLKNNKSVVVRVNDRHPAQHGATLDLSKAAAQKIGAIQAGVVPVEIEVLKKSTTSNLRTDK